MQIKQFKLIGILALAFFMYAAFASANNQSGHPGYLWWDDFSSCTRGACGYQWNVSGTCNWKSDEFGNWVECASNGWFIADQVIPRRAYTDLHVWYNYSENASASYGQGKLCYGFSNQSQNYVSAYYGAGSTYIAGRINIAGSDTPKTRTTGNYVKKSLIINSTATSIPVLFNASFRASAYFCLNGSMACIWDNSRTIPNATLRNMRSWCYYSNAAVSRLKALKIWTGEQPRDAPAPLHSKYQLIETNITNNTVVNTSRLNGYIGVKVQSWNKTTTNVQLWLNDTLKSQGVATNNTYFGFDSTNITKGTANLIFNFSTRRTQFNATRLYVLNIITQIGNGRPNTVNTTNRTYYRRTHGSIEVNTTQNGVCRYSTNPAFIYASEGIRINGTRKSHNFTMNMSYPQNVTLYFKCNQENGTITNSRQYVFRSSPGWRQNLDFEGDSVAASTGLARNIRAYADVARYFNDTQDYWMNGLATAVGGTCLVDFAGGDGVCNTNGNTIQRRAPRDFYNTNNRYLFWIPNVNDQAHGVSNTLYNTTMIEVLKNATTLNNVTQYMMSTQHYISTVTQTSQAAANAIARENAIRHSLPFVELHYLTNHGNCLDGACHMNEAGQRILNNSLVRVLKNLNGFKLTPSNFNIYHDCNNLISVMNYSIISRSMNCANDGTANWLIISNITTDRFVIDRADKLTWMNISGGRYQPNQLYRINNNGTAFYKMTNAKGDLRDLNFTAGKNRVVTIMLASLYLPKYDLNKNISAYFKFEEQITTGAGNGTWYFNTPYLNNSLKAGTSHPNYPVRSNGKIGYAAYLNNNVFDAWTLTYTPDTLEHTSTYSVNFWMNQTSTSVSRVISFWNYGAYTWGNIDFTCNLNIQQVGNDGNCYISYNNTASHVDLFIPDGTVSVNVWHMVSLVLNSSKAGNNATAKLYVDGSLAASGTIKNANFSNSWDRLIINRYKSGVTTLSKEFFVDELAVWNRSLTPKEVSFLYNSNKPGVNQQYPFFTLFDFKTGYRDIYHNKVNYSVNWTTSLQSNATIHYGLCPANNTWQINRANTTYNFSQNILLNKNSLYCLAIESCRNGNTCFNKSFSVQTPNVTSKIIRNKIDYTYRSLTLILWNYTFNWTTFLNANTTVFYGSCTRPNLRTLQYNNDTTVFRENITLNHTTDYCFNFQACDINSECSNTSLTLTTPSFGNISLRIFDEQNSRMIRGRTINVQLIRNNDTYNYSQTIGSFNITNVSATAYEIRYSATGYYPRSYYTSIYGGTHAIIDLYLLNDTDGSRVLHTVYDEFGEVLPNVTVILMRQYGAIFNTVGMSKTDAEGQTIMYAELYDIFYKMMYLDYKGNLLKVTDASTINVVTPKIQIVTQEDVFSSWRDMNGVYHNISFQNVSGTIYARYQYYSPVAIKQACLDVQQVEALRIFSKCYNCSTSVAGSLTCVLDAIHTFKVIGSIETATNHSSHTVESQWYNAKPLRNPMGREGILYVILIVFTVVLLGASVMIVSLILLAASIITMWALGFVFGLQLTGIWYIIVIVGIILFTYRRVNTQ